MRTITIANGLSVSADAARPPTVVSTDQAPTPRRVSYDGQDYTMRRPQIHVGINERVEAGQVLFSDKKNECLRVLSGVSGTVASIDLGARRSLQKLVVKVDAPVDNDGYPLPESVVTGLNSTHGNDIRAALVAAGLFHPFRTWPFNKTPTPDSSPRHIFVTAMDTNPYAADARAVLDARKDYFRTGLEIISKLTEGSVYVCQAPGEPLVDPLPAKVVSIGFKGPHPCGNTGTHIQAISPVSREYVVWSIDYQEVIAIGEAASTGRFSGNRTVSVYSVLSGHQYLISSLIGADLHSQLGLSTDHSKVRYWSGNPYTGGYADYLGRFDRQVFVMGPDQHSRQPDAGLLQKARFRGSTR